jgi:hypothetical protein
MGIIFARQQRGGLEPPSDALTNVVCCATDIELVRELPAGRAEVLFL